MLSSSASGGTAPLLYQWFSGSSATCSLDAPIAGATASTYDASPLATTDYCYTVTDSFSPPASAASPAATVNVNPALVAGPIAPGALGIDLGQNLTLSSNQSGGTVPYSFHWSSGSSQSCASETVIAGQTNSTLVVAASITKYYCYTVTDSATSHVTLASQSVRVIVGGPLTAGGATPTAPMVDDGQSVLLSANATGGTAPYTYQWFAGPSVTCSVDTLVAGATSSTYSPTPSEPTYYCYALGDSSLGTPTAHAESPTDLASVNSALAAGPVTPNLPVIDSGETIVLSAAASGGTPSYTYQWYGGSSAACASDVPVPGATASTLSTKPSIDTYFCYAVSDASSNPPSVRSATDLVTVSPALVAGNATPKNPSIDLGQALTLTADPSGGTAPYTYAWFAGTSPTCMLDSLISGQTNATLVTSPSSQAFYCYRVTDGAMTPVSATSQTSDVTVNSVPLAGTPTPASSVIDAGEAVTLTSAATKGTAPYSYQWYAGTSTNCSNDSLIAGATAATYRASPSSATYYCYRLGDAAVGAPAATAVSATVHVAVNSALVAAPLTASTPSIDSGQSVTLTANPSGGTTPYGFSWFSGTSAACTSDSMVSGQTGSTLVASPTASTYYCYKVTDASTGLPNGATSSTTLVTVVAALVAGAVTPGTPALDSGQSVTLVAHPSGGAPPYSYAWFSGSSAICSNDAVVPSATSATYVASPSQSEYFCYSVTDSAVTPVTAFSPGVEVVVNPPLSANGATPASVTIDIGESVTLTANPSGGTGTYTYQWYSGTSPVCSSDTPVSGATSATLKPSPTSTTYYCYAVTDSSATPVTVASAGDLVTVNPAPVAGAITPGAAVIDDGQSITLTADPSLGTAPYGFQWYAGGSATCAMDTAIFGATSATLVTSPSTKTFYCYKVTDASVGSPSAGPLSATVVVTVNPALVAGAATPGNPTIDDGQSVTLTAAASGGTPAYGYQWFTGTSPACQNDTAIGGATGSTYVATPTVNTYYCYELTDHSVGSPPGLHSVTDLITVHPPLTAAAVSPGGPSIPNGGSVTLTAHPGGGATPYSYQWYGGTSPTCANDPAIPGATAATYLATPAANTYFCYEATDSAPTPVSAFSSTDLVTVTLAAGAVSPASATIDDGVAITLTATASGGALPYSLQWYSGSSATCTSDVAVAGATGTTYRVGPSANTYYCYSVTDSSSTPVTVYSSTGYVTVNPALVLAPVSPSAPGYDVGQALNLSASASGGTPPYAYQWYSGASSTCSADAAIAGATSTTYEASSSSSAFYCYGVTDGATPASEQFSTTDPVTVSAAPTAGAPTPGSPLIDDGQTITLIAAVSGGTAPLHYQWFTGTSSACASDVAISGANSATYVAAPDSGSTYCYTVTDSSPTPKSSTSTTDAVTVGASLIAGPVTPSTIVLDVGQSATLTAAASGGAMPYTYQWYSGSSPSCSADASVAAATKNTLAITPSGSTYFCYRVSDTSVGSPTGVFSTTVLANVNPALVAGAVTPGTSTIDGGQTVTLTLHVTGGSGADSYQWYQGTSSKCASDTAIAGATGATYGASPAANTYYCYKVTDSAPVPVSVLSSAIEVTLNLPLIAGDVNASSTSLTTGGSVTLTATLVGGTSPYTYQWYSGSSANCSDDAPIPGATSSTLEVAPSSTQYYCYVVTDSASTPVSAVSPGLEVSVGPKPTLFGLPPTEGYAVIVVVVLAAIGVGAYFLVRGRGKASRQDVF